MNTYFAKGLRIIEGYRDWRVMFWSCRKEDVRLGIAEEGLAFHRYWWHRGRRIEPSSPTITQHLLTTRIAHNEHLHFHFLLE